MRNESLEISNADDLQAGSPEFSVSPSTGSTAAARKNDEVRTQWADTQAEFPEACVHELFEMQVRRTPNAIAVVGKGKSLSYHEVNVRANQVANYLRDLGVGPESLVGVCMKRSPDLIVALFGVWKAGGAYVPLDPTYPQERLEFMVSDAGVSALITEAEHKHLFDLSQARIVCLDTDWPKLARRDDGNLVHYAAPFNLAYVMYTSGSTGRPKGAMIVHRGLVNYLWWAIREYDVRAGGSVPVHSSISFDLTVTSLYPALLVGGQVELLEEDVGALNLLSSLRQRKNRNLVKITPAHLETLSQQLSAPEMEGLTDLFVIGGEGLFAENLRVWREAAPRTRLINEYGPTETVVGCCVYEIRQNDPHNGPVPIGRPIVNMRMYILDENLRPLAQGVVGELYIGGVGVARGYLNREDLTKERFLSDPFVGDPDARMYKTGDLARCRKDGLIEYLGRTDNQVKNRGYRIELGEIEAVLASWPLTQSCVVLAREDTPGDKQLVGYLVLRGNQEAQTEDLREFLRLRLPEYMIPARFVFLDSFPLTPNGKIDRKALSVSTEYSKPLKQIVYPANPLEQMLVGIWEKILKVAPIGVTDDFFDLGGHSLLAVKVSVEVEKVCHIRLPLAVFFETPTIAGLADHLRKQNWTPSWSSLVPIRVQGTKPPLFLMHSHGGNSLEYHALANLLEKDQPVYTLQSRGLDGHIQSDASIEEMAADYIEEIRSIRPVGPYLLAGFCLGGLLALEAAQQLTAAGEEVPLLVLIHAINPPSMGFRSEITRLKRLWHTATKRVDLELENLSYRGWNYVTEKRQSVLKNLICRTALRLGYVKVDGEADLSHLPMQYILEAIAIEHTKAIRRYIPRPYKGNSILFLASKRLRGGALEKDLGWGRILCGKLEVCEINGHYQNLLLHPSVEQLASELGLRLSAAQQGLASRNAR